MFKEIQNFPLTTTKHLSPSIGRKKRVIEKDLMIIG
jgi:hypothetical protein